MVAEIGDGGDSCGHGQGIAAQCASLIDGAEGSELVHDAGTSAECADGQAAADDLAEGREVGANVVEFLGATHSNAETGHDLVKNEEGSVFGGKGTERLQVARGGWNAAGVADDRLDDDAGDFSWVFVEGRFNGSNVV